MHHIWARGEGGGCIVVQKQVPSPVGEKWYPSKKSMVLSMVYPFSWPEKLNQFLLCRQFKSNKNWELMRIQEKVFKNSQRAIFILKHFFCPSPLHPLPFTQTTAAKNITSPESIFDPCTHSRKSYSSLCEKSLAHVWRAPTLPRSSRRPSQTCLSTPQRCGRCRCVWHRF